LESYTKALGMLETLFRRDSSDLRTRRDLAEVSMAVGAIVWERGDLAGGLAYTTRARGMLDALVAVSPGDIDQRLKLHRALDLLGQMSLEGGEVARAAGFHRADLKQFEQIGSAERRRPDIRRAMSLAYGHLADTQVDAGDLNGALESHRRSLELRSQLAVEFPDNADYEYLINSARYYMADVLSRLDRWSEALEMFQTNLAGPVAGGLTHFRAGDALMHLGRPAEALGHFRSAVRSQRKENAADTASLYSRMALALDQSGICKATAVLGRGEAPAACAGTAAYIMATPVEPTHAFARAHFGGIWFDLGEAYERLAAHPKTPPADRASHRVAARDMYQRSLEIWSDLTARKLISPIDTSRLTTARRAVERATASCSCSP
jgi:tetratricopeptide (TPR) repeat protein